MRKAGRVRPVLCFTLSVIFPSSTVVSLADAVVGPAKVADDHSERVKVGTKLFRTSVRNVLIDRCLGCHGGEMVEGGFNLATRAGLLRGGEHGAAILPGRSAESRLYWLITHAEQPHMPHNEDQLSKSAIAAIVRWIDLDAPYDKPLVDEPVELQDWTRRTVPDNAREFRAFRPLRDVRPPVVADEQWCRTDIDRFVLHVLEKRGLEPSRTADRRLLIRRTWFSLIGLPPEPTEVERFIRDSSPDWHERMVEELLDSRHFGERWARHWLDIARFAESHGFEHDFDREFAYHYRDFVIKAFNSDLPYDQFVQWQLAGDEIAPDNPLALMATGFLGAGVFPTQLTEREFESARYDELDDMVSTMGTALLGMTIGCARCHDHKYDPIPSADYYRLISTFTTTIRSNIEVDLNPEETQRALAQWESDHKPLVEQLREFENRQLVGCFEEWMTKRYSAPVRQSTPHDWLTVHVKEARSAGGATLTVQPNKSILATGRNPDFDTCTLTAETQIPGVCAIRLEALAHESLPHDGPGRAPGGNIGLSSIRVMAQPLSGESAPVDVRLRDARATFQQNSSNFSIAASLDKTPNIGWAVAPQFGRDHAAVFEFAEPVGFKGGTRLTVMLEFRINKQHSIGCARLSISAASPTPPLDASSRPLAMAELDQLIGSNVKVTHDGYQTLLLALYRTIDPQWQKLSAEVAAHIQARPAPQFATVMACSEGVTPIKHNADGRGFPHFYPQTFFLRRGDTTQKVRTAEPGFLQVLTTVDEQEAGWKDSPPAGWRTSFRRRALANWITDTNGGAGHLLARVIVNRLWQHHMGNGLVATPNDFGQQGARPTHPELLDWLAQKLIDAEWRLKSIHKLILMSAVFQQSADYDRQRAVIDSENRFYWRHTPRRLEAEAIRDAMLAISRQLDPTSFGPGTLDESHKRRSVYFKIKRSKLIPMMQIFDMPEPLVSVGNRPSTTIASQALVFMNSPQVREYARGFARRVQSRDRDDVVHQAWLTSLSRHPTAAERTAATKFLLHQSESYAADGRTVIEADVLALTDLCQMIFSLNEFVYLE